MQTPAANTYQDKIELRILNCLYGMQAHLPTPFMPLSVLPIGPLAKPASDDTPHAYLIKTLVEGVHPKSETRGQIGVGSLRISTTEFYDRMMDEMGSTAFGPVVQSTPVPDPFRKDGATTSFLTAKSHNNARQMEQFVAETLLCREILPGAEKPKVNFTALQVVGVLSQARDWLDQSRQNSSSDRDKAVWGKMGHIVTYVQGAVVEAAQSGLIDDQMARSILFDASDARKNLAAPYADWAPPATAILGALSKAVMTKEGEPASPPLTSLAYTLTMANMAYESAKSGNMLEMPSGANRLGLGRSAQRPDIAYKAG